MADIKDSATLTQAELREARRAALGLMEDAVQARQLAEKLNQTLRSEIAERKQVEALLRVQNEALEMVAGPGSLLDVLQVLVRAVESQSREAMMAAIHLTNPAGTHLASTIAPSLPAAYVEATEGLEVAARIGPCCDAILTGASVSVADVACDTRYPRFAELAAKCGIRAAFSTPIASPQGKVMGTFALYYREPRDPAALDRQMIAFVARTAALAIEQRQAQESTARLAAIVTSSRDAIISKDLDGVITTWNRGAELLFGYSAEEVVGKVITILFPADHIDEEPQILARIGRGEVVDHYQTVRRRKDGTLVHVSLTVSPVRDANGRIIGASKVARDITEHRQAEDALRASEQKMKEQADALADLHRRKDEFLAMLSHELRNPLAPISSAVHLLRLQKDEDQLQRSARMIIERQVRQLTRLVDDLLEVSRITTGRIHLQQEQIVLNEVVENAIETVRPLIAQRGHTLEVKLPSSPIWLSGDAARLEQAVVNLLTNAAKYTEEGGRIWVTLDDQGREAVLCVRDSGIGIAPELLPRIFDLFTQAERSLDRSQGGLGIGLSLVHRLVHMHGGRIEAQSVLGQGSEFVVRLPSVPAPVSSPSLAKGKSTEGGPGLRVLVVDDNLDALETFDMLLRADGNEVRTAREGQGAIEAAFDFLPDVVLLDVGLPGMNGFEVAARLRQSPNLERAVLIAMTGYGQESDRKRSMEAGFDHHLVKPVDYSKVQGMLAAVKPVRSLESKLAR